MLYLWNGYFYVHLSENVLEWNFLKVTIVFRLISRNGSIKKLTIITLRKFWVLATKNLSSKSIEEKLVKNHVYILWFWFRLGMTTNDQLYSSLSLSWGGKTKTWSRSLFGMFRWDILDLIYFVVFRVQNTGRAPITFHATISQLYWKLAKGMVVGQKHLSSIVLH